VVIDVLFSLTLAPSWKIHVSVSAHSSRMIRVGQPNRRGAANILLLFITRTNILHQCNGAADIKKSVKSSNLCRMFMLG
jgi:hypothetical protein